MRKGRRHKNRRDTDMKFDMHCHTKEGSLDGKVPVQEYIRILKEKGFDGMLVSDHNSYKGYQCFQEWEMTHPDPDFVILKGVEYDTIDGGHILVIMPEDVKLRILELRGLPVRFLVEIVHAKGGILGPAHPCGDRYVSIFNTRRHRYKREVMESFDFLEGFNACEAEESNKEAQEIAKKYHKPALGGSDAHKMACVGLAYTWFADEIRRESDLISCIKAGEGITCGGSYYRGTTRAKIGKAKEILIRGFWIYNRLGSFLKRHRRKLEMRRFRISKD